MSENISNSKNVRDDEIDLLDLFKRMGRALSRLANGIGKAILVSSVFLVKRWLPLSISIILGVVISVFLNNTSESSYTSDLVLRSNIDETDELITYINRLQTFCSGDKQHLAKAINLNPDQTENIRDIRAYWIIDNGNDGIPDYVDYNNQHNIYDTSNTRMKDRIDIRVRIVETQELSIVSNGIISFINSDQILQQRNKLRLKQNREMLARLEYDILQLDSLQKYIYFHETRNFLPKDGAQMFFMQEQKTQLVYSDIHKLFEQKQKLEHENSLYGDIVTVISEFSIPTMRDNNLMYYATKIVPVFFLLTLLVLIIKANSKKLKDVYIKY